VENVLSYSSVAHAQPFGELWKNGALRALVEALWRVKKCEPDLHEVREYWLLCIRLTSLSLRLSKKTAVLLAVS